jgi:hypothetical protein
MKGKEDTKNIIPKIHETSIQNKDIPQAVNKLSNGKEGLSQGASLVENKDGQKTCLKPRKKHSKR